VEPIEERVTLVRREILMIRFSSAIAFACLCWCSGIATAQLPDYFKLQVVETQRKTVEITSVDPKGLAWQMGLRTNDTIQMIGTTRIQSRKELERELKNLSGKFEIKVRRVVGNAKERKVEEKTLEGELRKRGDDPSTFIVDKP
jgi:hypothetical protein